MDVTERVEEFIEPAQQIKPCQKEIILLNFEEPNQKDITIFTGYTIL